MQGGGFGAPPGGYGPPGAFGPPGYGGPPQGYGPPAPQQGWQQPPPPKKGNAGLLIGIIAGVLLLLAGVAAGAAYFVFFAKPAPHLARYVPKTSSVYIEMPSVKKSLMSTARMKPLDSSRVDEKQMMEDTITAFASSFSLTQAEAKTVVDGIDAMSFAVRDTNTSGKSVGVLSFTSEDAADKLTHSARFTLDGPYGTVGGKSYKLARRTTSTSAGGAHPNLLEEMLNDMSLTGSRERIVWFAKPKILVFGDDAMVTDVDGVLAGGTDSLEMNEAYKKAKRSFESGSDVAFFFDTHDFDDVKGSSQQKLLEAYLHGREPVTGAVKIVKAGIMMDLHMTLSGSAMPPDEILAPAPKLDFPHKLPADTVAYMAFSTKTKMSGAAVRTTLLERIQESDPSMAKEVRDGLDAMERSLGFSFTDLCDMVGDEVAFGILLDPTFKIDSTNGLADEIANVGLVYAIAVKDEAKARMILGKIRTKLEDKDVAELAKVRALGTDGFEVDPQTTTAFPVPNLTVKYDNKKIVAVLANGSLSNRAFDALMKGKGTLKDDSAHELAFGALPQDANYYMWLDTGRITSLMMDGVGHVRKGAYKSLLPLEAIRLTGPDRVTSALAGRATSKNGIWTIDVDSLNLPATALFSVAKDLDLSMPSGPLFGK